MMDFRETATAEPGPASTLFDGVTARKADEPRMNAQLQRVFNAMGMGRWRRPQELEEATGDNWSSVNARLRDLRKPKFGGWIVDRRRVPGQKGLFEYRLRGPGERA